MIEETLEISLGARMRQLLPPSWDVDVVPDPDSRVDAVLNLTTPARGSFNVAVVVKRWSTEPSSRVAGVLSNVQRSTTFPLLLVTDYTNRPLRQACEDLGISYLDRLGWSYIRIDDPNAIVLIRTEGADRSPPKVSTEITRLNGIAAGRTLRTLLDLVPPIGVRDLADLARVKSPGSVSKLLPTLASAGAIERDDEGRVVEVRRRVLLERWTQDYTFRNGNGLVLDYLAPRGLDPVLERLQDASQVCVTGAFAGRAYLRAGTVPVVPPVRLSAYVRDLSLVADELGLIRVDRQSANVTLAVPRDIELLANPMGQEDLPLAPRPQVLADLLTMPGRESLMAEQIMDQLASADNTWSE